MKNSGRCFSFRSGYSVEIQKQCSGPPACGRNIRDLNQWRKKVGLEICFAAALAVMLAGGTGALIAGKKPSLAAKTGCAGLLAGTVIAAIPAGAGLFVDHINVFRIPVLLLGAAGAVHSLGYLRGHGEERSGLYFFFYNLTVSAMLGVTLAIRPLPFLVLWEIMGIASFVLVAFDYKSQQTLRAAWIYLLACQAGGMVLIAMFLFSCTPGVAFALAVIGFGLKIGFPLLHVWLPEAHPAAPAPVSSLMSGAMIQLGFFGIMRWGINTAAPASGMIGITLLILGAVSCLGGIILSMPRTNIKTMLAYSSIENMGIIALGSGLGFIGLDAGHIPTAFCGFAGAFLHMVNHALLKGGLFLLAGSVQKAAGSLEMEKMGGLLKRMPVTGTLFLLNSAGLSGLPPFNAFVSELLIYLAAFTAASTGKVYLVAAGIPSAVILALTGGLAAAAFCKTASAVFLGEPRSERAAATCEVPFVMSLPVILLFAAGCCVTVISPFLVRMAIPAEQLQELEWVFFSLRTVAAFSFITVVIFLILLAVKLRLLPRGRECRRSATWDCGYGLPDARMEYTGSAFIQPLVQFCGKLTGVRKKITPPEGDFPETASYEEENSDPGLDIFWKNIFRFFAGAAEKMHFLQSGYLHLYILIATAALILMLIWGLLLPWGGTLFKGGF